MAGKPGKGGPKKGQPGNRLKNGSRLNAKRLVVGELPKSMIAVKREARAYRRQLEVQVEAVKGEVSFSDMHHIDTAAAATVQAGVCRWLLRNKMEKMSPAEIRGCTADITKAKERRDNAVKAMNLDAPPPDPWSSLGAITLEQPTTPPAIEDKKQ